MILGGVIDTPDRTDGFLEEIIKSCGHHATRIEVVVHESFFRNKVVRIYVFTHAVMEEFGHLGLRHCS